MAMDDDTEESHVLQCIGEDENGELIYVVDSRPRDEHGELMSERTSKTARATTTTRAMHHRDAYHDLDVVQEGMGTVNPRQAITWQT